MGVPYDRRHYFVSCLQRLREYVVASGLIRALLMPSMLGLLLCCALLTSTVVLYRQILPVITDVQYARGSTPLTDGEFPLSLPSDGTDIVVQFRITIPVLHPDVYSITADDCITQWVWDDQIIRGGLFEHCTPDRANAIRFFPPLLAPGAHTVRVHITDPQGGRTGFDFATSYEDPLVRIFTIFLLLFSGLMLFFFWKVIGRGHAGVFLALLIAVFLRIGYAQATPYNIRSNDVEGHIDYISWMREHRTIPHAKDGWQFYQPPLYYAVSAVIADVGQAAFHSKYITFRILQLQGFAYSVGSFLILIWTSTMLFPLLGQGRRREQLLFLFILATAPVLVAGASKINNDVLVQLLSFSAIALLIRFWQKGGLLHWYALIAVMTLGILTKFTMVLFVPAAFICLALHHGLPRRRKIVMGLFAALIIVVCTEWYFVLRYAVDAGSFPVGNIGNLNGALLIQATPAHLIGFDPFRFVSIPFLNAFEDASGRQYFFEYFLKSGLVGDFNFGPHLAGVSRALLLMVLFLIPFGCIGFIRFVLSPHDRHRSFPLIVVFFVLLLGHVLFWITTPYSCSADFRYSLVLAIPMTYFVVIGTQNLPRILRWTGTVILGCFIALCIDFTALVIFYRP